MSKKIIALLISVAFILPTFPVIDIVSADSIVDGIINVDLSNDRGSFVRMENYGNYTGRPIDQNGSVRTEDMKFMQYNGLNQKMMRMWLNLQDDFIYYDSNNNVTTTGSQVVRAAINPSSSTIRHFNEMSPFVEEFLVCIQQPNMITSNSWDANGLKKRYAAAVTALVSAYPKSKYFECVNEPDLGSGNYFSSVDQYYDYYYKPHYEGMKIANDNLGLTGTGNELKLGGPVTAMFMPSGKDADGNSLQYYIRDFIRRYKDDTSQNKRLDFISYHEYGGSYKGDSAFFGTEQSSIRNWLSENWNGKTLDIDMPVFVSETGMFAGNQTSNLDFYADLFVEAAGVASMNYHYVYNGYGKPNQIMPFMWVPRHTKNDNWRKNMLVTDRLDNSSGAILSKFTPFGNMFKMLAMLRDKRVGTSVSPERTGNAGDGKSLGLYAFGTKDDNGVGVMMWNYQYDNRSSLAAPFNSGNVTYNVTANINNINSIPAFDGKDVLVKLYRIDAVASSYAHQNDAKIPNAIVENSNGDITINKSLLNLDGANLVPYSEYIATPINNQITVNYTFDRNKFRFIELVPVPRLNIAEGRDVTTSATSGLSAEYAVDGNDLTRWGAPDNKYPYTITSDAGVITTMTGAQINWYKASERAYKYKIQASTDGINFTTVIDNSNNVTKGITTDNFNCQARYLRIEVIGCSVSTGFASINELKVFGQPENLVAIDNISINPEVISSDKTTFHSSGTYSSNPSIKAFDGNLDTEWKGQGVSTGQFVGVDLGYPAKLTKTEIDWFDNNGSRSYKYLIEGSLDGNDYFVIKDATSNTIIGQTIDETLSTARYVRIRVVGSNVGSSIDARIREIRVYGYPAIHSWYNTAKAEEYFNGEWEETDNSNNADVKKMFDGDLNTRWGASNGNFPYRVTLDMSAPHMISDIEINWYEGESGVNQRIYRYIIETSNDNIDYQLAYDGSQNKDIANTHNPVDKKSRFVRVTILGCSDGGYASIKEMKVNGIKPPYTIYQPEFASGAFRIFNLKDGAVSSQLRVKNNYYKSMPIILLLAFYDNNNNFIKSVSKSENVEKGTDSVITATSDSVPDNAFYAKALVLNSLGNIRPYINYELLCK